MNKTTKIMSFLAATFLSFATWADKLPNGFEYTSSGPVVPGEWTCQYTKAMELAQAENIPVIAFLVKADCAYCKKVETCWMQNESFRTELKKRGYILLIGVYAKSPEYGKVQKLTAGGGSLPLMGTYWLTEDGVERRTKFTGRAGEMSVPSQGAPNTAESGFLETGLQLLARLEKDLGDYKPIPANTVGACAENNAENDRLEFDAATTETIVRITRDEKAAEVVTNGYVIVKNKAGTKTETPISWPVAARTAGAGTEQAVTVTIPAGTYKAGDTLSVYVADEAKTCLATNTMTYVELGNSASNPKWLGEEVAFGEWTQDLEAAKALAAGAEGAAYTLAYVAGTRWCPDCHATEEHFLGSTDFTTWATDRQVALAVIDVPRFVTNSLDTVEKATILSRDAYTASNYGTGLGYLTRKNISDADAAEVLERNRKFVSESIDATGIHSALEDSNPYRTGVPYFVMLRKDGSVAARLTRLSSVAPTSAANNAKYLARLDEMLAIAATTGDHADATEAKNNAIGEGAIVLAANGGSVTGELSHADPVDVMGLTGVTGSANVEVAVKGAADVSVTARFYVQTNAAVAAVAVGTPATGKLSGGISINYTLPESVTKAYLVLDATAAAKTDAGAMGVLSSAPTFAPYTAAAKVVYKPVEKRNLATAAEGEITVELTEGTMYRFDGLKNDKVGDALEAVYPEDPLCKFFKAKTGGNVTLAANETVGYQLWKPGSVGFAETAKAVSESVCDKTQTPLKLALKRSGGASGEVKVRVSVDLDATKFEPAENYTLLTTNDVVWADGDSDDKTVELWIEDDIDFYQQVGQIVLKATVVSSEAGDVELTTGQEALTVTVTEDDKSLPGRGQITRLSELEAKKATAYLREGETFTFWAERVEAASGLVAAELKASVAGISFATDDPSDMGVEAGKTVLYWASHEADEKAVYATGFAAGKTTKLSLLAYKTFKTVAGANAVTVVCVAKDAPAFASEACDREAARYVAFDETFALTGTTGGALAFTKLSGALPAGLKVTAADGAMRVAGVPTKAGTYEAVYQVTETRGKTKVPGLVTKLAFTVVDPVAAGSAPDGKGVLNPACKVSRTFSDVMIVDPAAALASDPENTEHRCLYGTLTLTLPATGKASAKATTVDGTVSFKATSWSEVDFETGELTTTLASTTKGSDATLTVRALADAHGTVNIDILVNDQLVTIPLDGRVWTKTDSAEKYQGAYTVTLPAMEKETTGTRTDLAPTGSAYLTAKMTSAGDFAKGKMTWAGKLANGTAVSGSSILNRLQANCSCHDEADVPAYLPIFKVMKADAFSAPLEIPYDAKKRWSEEGDHDCVVLQPIIQEGEGSFKLYGCWSHQETTGAGFVQVLNVYGAPYDISKGLDCCALDFSYSTNMTFSVSMPAVSDTYGALGPVTAVPVVIGEKTIALARGAANPQSVTLSFAAATGIVKGSFKLPVAAGSKAPLTASFEGVVVLGWNADDCGCTTEEVVKLPLVNGFWTFSDKYGYTDVKGAAKTATVKRGGAVGIE